MRIDSHHHFWRYSPQEYGWISDGMDILKRDYLPEHLHTEISRMGIHGVISVQARTSLEETQALLKRAKENTWIEGVVGWVPLLSPELPRLLDSFSGEPLLKAVRHVVQDEPDDDFLLREDFSQGVAGLLDTGLAYDILVYARQLPATIPFVDRHPDQVFILDHIAKPTIRADRFDADWSTRFKELAKRPNVYCKFSGVVTEVRDPAWSISTIQPYWDTAWDAFGPDRLMYGSDWPVCRLRSEYADWVTVVEQLSSGLSDSESAAFWSETARRAYRLESRAKT